MELSVKHLKAIEDWHSQKSADEKPRDVELNSNSINWKEFDPNSASLVDLVGLGLDSSIANRMMKYRRKGGKFRDVSDVAKMYGIDQNWVRQAQPFLVFPKPENLDREGGEFKEWNSDSNQTADSNNIRVEKIAVAELNALDSATLLKIPWVGPFTAGEIIELRERLGGFKSYDQLVDIFRIRDEAIENIITYTTLDTSLVSKIDLNSCTLQKLGRHPYITWKQAKIILNYRKQHGPYQNTRGILQTGVISDSLYSKIAFYLSVE
jgi:DNA uptake protein ComE-like DNA-binding protein